MGALQYGSGIISSLLLALFSDGTPWTMGWIIALFTAASALMGVRLENGKYPTIRASPNSQRQFLISVCSSMKDKE
jgi:hypothetical protein